jgi:hypothetical protein
MKPEIRINFKTENFVVDWIGFSLKGSDRLKSIGEYLFHCAKFNVRQKIAGQSSNSEIVLWDNANEFKCVFVEIEASYWQGSLLNFSGKSAAHFYDLLQKQTLDLTFLDLKSTNLTRLDINYQRRSKKTDPSQDEFFQEAVKKLEKTDRYISYNSKKSSGDRILRIGRRPSPRFYRIYSTKDGLKFEFEIKGRTVKSFQEDLFYNRLEDFEKNVSEHFYEYSKRLLPATNSYTDWLIIYRRKVKKETNPKTALVTTYLKSSLSKNQSERDALWKFFQLVTFIGSLKDAQKTKKILSHQVYYEINFQLQEFVQFTGVRTNMYQLKKAKEFLEIFYNLQKNQGVINQISETSFRSFVAFPALSLRKIGKAHKWTVSFSMAEEFYFYRYPFIFPIEFTKFQGKHDMQIKVELVHAMSRINLKKRLDVEDFLAQFLVSNSVKATIKEKILYLFNLLQKEKCIESEFVIIDKFGSTISVAKLSISLLTKARYLYFFERKPD